MKCLECGQEAVDGGLYCPIHPDLGGMSSLQDLKPLIKEMLEHLDASLMSLNDQPELWNRLYKARTALDEKQVSLIKAGFRADDIQFQKLTADIQEATKKLNEKIDDMTRIDSIVNLISQIASEADSVLKLV